MSDTIETPESTANENQTNFLVPVKLGDMSIFDGAYTFMRERFSDEMRRIDDEMMKLSSKMSSLFESNPTMKQAGQVAKERPSVVEELGLSPLFQNIEGKLTLNLQFDVSQFDPEDVTVQIVNNILTVSASHEEKTDHSSVVNQYRKEFLLPVGISPESLESTLTKDGVLLVKVPLDMVVKESSQDTTQIT